MRNRPHVFVARPFDQRGTEIFERLVEPTLLESRMASEQGRKVDAGAVVETVVKLIENSVGVIAITSGRNRNVYIELGMAIAFQKPLILVADNLQDCGMLSETCSMALLGDRENFQITLARFLKSLTRHPL